jgi:plasmid maintenance system killer protein
MMEVSFANSRLQKLCNSAKKLRGEYGPRMAGLIQQRLAELSDVETLEDMRSIVGANCHELTQNLKGRLGVNLVHPDRLVFKAANDPVPRKPDGGLDWKQVTSIEVVGIGDYH